MAGVCVHGLAEGLSLDPETNNNKKNHYSPRNDLLVKQSQRDGFCMVSSLAEAELFGWREEKDRKKSQKQLETQGNWVSIDMHVCSLSQVWLFVTQWTVACQAPLPMGFPRQEHWSGLPCPLPEDLPDPRIEPASLASPALAGGFFITEPSGMPNKHWRPCTKYNQNKHNRIIINSQNCILSLSVHRGLSGQKR